jgi:hypothetical protein
MDLLLPSSSWMLGHRSGRRPVEDCMSHFGLLREENDRTNLDYLEDSPLVMPWVRRCDLRSTSVAREARRYRS